MPITVSGGDKIARFVEAVTDPAFETRLFAKVLRTFVLPELKRHCPVRTGKLRLSLRVYQRGEDVQIRGSFVGHLVRFKSPISGNTVNMPALTIEIILRNKQRIVALYREAMRNAAGV